MTNPHAWLFGLLLLISQPSHGAESDEVAHKVGYEKPAGFAGPGSVRAQLEEDDQVHEPVVKFRIPGIDKGLQNLTSWKARVNESIGLQFGADYNTLYQSIDKSLTDEDDAWGDVLRVYGSWNLVGRETDDPGTLIFKVDHRHPLGTELTPGALGGEAGYLGQTGVLYSDVDVVLVDLNWQQSFQGGDTGLVVGRFDPNDYLNTLGYANPWTAFSNAWMIVNPSIALPDTSLGIGGGHWFDNGWYAKGSINDANGLVTETDGFDGGAEFFKWFEVGKSPSRDQRYTNNWNVAVWHVDDRDSVGLDSAHGVVFGANWTTQDNRWMTFVRGGWSSGDAPPYNKTLTAGFLRYFRRHSDLLGLAINWGEPPDNGLPNQTTTEAFYRLQLAQNFAITTSVQLLSKPAFNPEDDQVWVFGVRTRLNL